MQSFKLWKKCRITLVYHICYLIYRISKVPLLYCWRKLSSGFLEIELPICLLLQLLTKFDCVSGCKLCNLFTSHFFLNFCASFFIHGFHELQSNQSTLQVVEMFLLVYLYLYLTRAFSSNYYVVAKLFIQGLDFIY